MSKLNIDQLTILQLFGNDKTKFLIPDYQRPYAWGKTECQTLWDDLFNFSFPENDCSLFNRNDDYFLGPIVMFKNDNGEMEIIDGQQRLTTLMLLLRAFYEGFGHMEDYESKSTSKNIEQCIWETDEFEKADKSSLKINSEVANDADKKQFSDILKTGSISGNEKSNYAINYKFFQEKISEFRQNFASYFSFFPNRIMKNCILLPIEAESQDTALRIFSTLNDRGKPLSDADIFKAQFYKYYSDKGEKDTFIEKWNQLADLCEDIFDPKTGSPIDEIFNRYMYYERAKLRIRESTTVALRKFYEKDGYVLLKKDETFDNIIELAHFWDDVLKQNIDRFSDRVLKRLYVLNYAPNGMWENFVSVYYMSNKDKDGFLDDESFYQFLNKITAFIWAYALTQSTGATALRKPVYPEMINLIDGKPVTFENNLFDVEQLENAIRSFEFTNQRKLTRAMLTWWAFQDSEQLLLPTELKLQIEHIYAKKRHEMDQALTNPKKIESLGNKSILEKRINIQASDYRFSDKCDFYLGFPNNPTKRRKPTQINELIELATNLDDFTELNILDRETKIISGFMRFMKDNGLLK